MMAKKAIRSLPVGKTPVRSDIVGRLARRGVVVAEETRAKAARAVALGVREAATHKYRAGETVTLVPTRYGANRHGRFEVTRLLPAEQGVNHYRLKSVTDGHERVAREDELA
jgi:hypothetical protein